MANYHMKIGDLVRYKKWYSNDYPEGKVGVVLEMLMEDPRYPDEWQVHVYWNKPYHNLGPSWWEFYSELEVVNEGR